jgi:hypothetical protein
MSEEEPCVKCLSVNLQSGSGVNKPMKLKCGHLMCRKCINEHQQAGGTSKTLSCPRKNCGRPLPDPHAPVGQGDGQPDILARPRQKPSSCWYDNAVLRRTSPSIKPKPLLSPRSPTDMSESEDEQREREDAWHQQQAHRLPSPDYVQCDRKLDLVSELEESNRSSQSSDHIYLTMSLNSSTLSASPSPSPQCSACYEEATTYCTDCSNSYCAYCTTRHNSVATSHLFNGHDIRPILPERQHNQSINSDCGLHPGKLLEYYCDTCMVALCSTCVVQHEGSHVIVTLNEELCAQKMSDLATRLDTGAAEAHARLNRVRQKKAIVNEHYEATLSAVLAKVEQINTWVGNIQSAAVEFLEKERSATLKRLQDIEKELQSHMTTVTDVQDSAEHVQLTDTAKRLMAMTHLAQCVAQTPSVPEITLHKFVPSELDETNFVNLCFGTFIVQRKL